MKRTTKPVGVSVILACILMLVLTVSACSGSYVTAEDKSTEPDPAHIVILSNLSYSAAPAAEHANSSGFGPITYTSAVQDCADGVTLYEATRSTARIFATSSTTGEAVPKGSGFLFIHDGEVFFATNAHCIFGNSITSGFTHWRAVFGYGADWSFELPLISVIAYSNAYDLAVLEIDISGAEIDLIPIPLGDSGSLRIGDEVFTIGHPSDREERGEEYAANEPIRLRVLERHLFERRGTESIVLEGEIVPIPGSSGSPVVRRIGDTDRYVAVGVHFAGSSSDSGRGGGNVMPSDHLKRDYSERSGLSIEEAEAERRYYINHYSNDTMSMGEKYDVNATGIYNATRLEKTPDGGVQLYDRFSYDAENNFISPYDLRIMQFSEGIVQIHSFSDEGIYILSNTTGSDFIPRYSFFPSSFDSRVIPFQVVADQDNGQLNLYRLAESDTATGSFCSILTDVWGGYVRFVHLKSDLRDGYSFWVNDGFLTFGRYESGRFTGRWISLKFETTDFFAAESEDDGTLGPWVRISSSDVPDAVYSGDGFGSGSISYAPAGFVIEWSGYGDSYSMSTATQHFRKSDGAINASLTAFRGAAPYASASVDESFIYLNGPNSNHSGVISRAGGWFGLTDRSAGRVATVTDRDWYIGEVDSSGHFLASGSGVSYYPADAGAAWLYIGQFSSNVPSGQGTRLYSVLSSQAFRTVSDGIWDGWSLLENVWH